MRIGRTSEGRDMKLEDVVELASLDLQYPKVDKAKLQELALAK